MEHDPRKLLFDIFEACRNVTEFTAGLSFEQFTSSALVKSAVYMQFIVIGEALTGPGDRGAAAGVLRLRHAAAQPGHLPACGHDELVAVFRTTGTRSRSRGNATFTWHDSTCPACGQRDRQILLGARNATLGAQVVAESWASPFNQEIPQSLL